MVVWSVSSFVCVGVDVNEIEIADNNVNSLLLLMITCFVTT